MILVNNQPLSEHEQAILFDAFNMYSKRCKTNATRALNGEGKASEYEKRQQWLYRHEDTENLLSKIAEDCN